MVPVRNPQQTWLWLCINVVATIARDRALIPRSFSQCDGNMARAWDGRVQGAACSLHLGHRSGSTAPGAHWLGGAVQGSDPWEAAWELSSCTHTVAKACAPN